MARYASAFLTVLAAVALIVLLTFPTRPVESAVDRQGGTRVTLTAHTFDGAPLTPDALSQAEHVIRSRVTGLGFTDSQIDAAGDTLTVTVPGDRPDEVTNLGQPERFYIRPVVNALQATPSSTPGPGPVGAVEGARAQPDLGERIAEEKKLRQSTSRTVQLLSLQYQATRCDKPDVLADNDDPGLPLVTCSADHKAAYLLGPSIVGGDDVQDAGSSFNQQSSSYAVDLQFTSAATRAWAKFTAAHAGTQAAFTVDTQVFSAPQIRAAIFDGKAQIASGEALFTAESARILANALKYGPLPVSFRTSDTQTIAPKTRSAEPSRAPCHIGLVITTIGLLMALLGAQVYVYRARIRSLLPPWRR